jgi:hypothetical protein
MSSTSDRATISFVTFPAACHDRMVAALELSCGRDYVYSQGAGRVRLSVPIHFGRVASAARSVGLLCLANDAGEVTAICREDAAAPVGR